MRFFMNTPIFSVLAAVGLDVLLGDPERLWHPVIGIGKLIHLLEQGLYKEEDSPRQQKWKGVLLALIAQGSVAFLVSCLLILSQRISDGLHQGVTVYLLWTGLAGKTLKKEGMKVYESLFDQNLLEARQRVGYLITRQTEEMTEEEVMKATVETVSENTSDGIIAPLFFGVLLGPLGMWLYKTGNTLDSMVGYKNRRYLHFGWFSAKADDVLNYIPARLTAVLLLLSAPFEGSSLKKAWGIYKTYRRCHESPNAGHPEAAAAGVLGIALGGDAVYFGNKVRKPKLGESDRRPESSDILRTVRMMDRAYGMGVGLFILLLAVWKGNIYG